MKPLPVFPAEPLWREMPVSRALLYTPFMDPKFNPPLQFPLTELPQRETLYF